MGVSNSKEPDTALAEAIARKGCILRGVVGSTVHGLSNPGTDDRDEMGVCVEPIEYIAGLRPFEHWVFRTQPEGIPSGPGDLDLTIYGLRKYCRLALKGSPTVLLLLFIDGDHVIERTGLSAYGYDTKYAMHALRIAHQGQELLRTGRISLPVAEPERSRLLEVRRGEVPLREVLRRLHTQAEGLEDAVLGAELREEPDRDAVDAFLVSAYQSAWAGELRSAT